jgi:DnaJ-class molecular chaperone
LPDTALSCPRCDHRAAVRYNDADAQTPDPSCALCDGNGSLTPEEYRARVCFRCRGIGVVDLGGPDFAVDAGCGRCGGTGRWSPPAQEVPGV